MARPVPPGTATWTMSSPVAKEPGPSEPVASAWAIDGRKPDTVPELNPTARYAVDAGAWPQGSR